MATDDPARMFRLRMGGLITTEFLWGFGTFFVLPSTTIPSFLNARGASPVVIGVMVAGMTALPLLLQLLGRNLMNLFERRKRVLILLHVPVILPYWLVPLCDRALAASPAAAVTVAIGLLSFSQIAIGLVIPLWLDMISRVIPTAWRGRYFGFSAGAFAVGGILGGLLLTWLERRLGASVYPAAFLLAGACFVASIATFAAVPIPEEVFVHAREASIWRRCRQSFGACGGNTDFGRMVWSYAGVILAAAILPFLVVYASDRASGLGYPEGIFGRLTLLQALGGAAGAVMLGWMVDHHGPRWPWVGATLIVPLVVLLFPHGRLQPVLAVASLLAGVLTTHWSVSAPALLELSPEGDKSAYVATANVIGFVPAAVGPILLGALIQRAGYPAAFAAAGLAGLLAAIPALAIRGRAQSGSATAEEGE